MNLLPLIERELRVAARRWPSACQVRVLCAVAGFVVAFGIVFIWSAWHPTAGFGRPFLEALAGVGFTGSLVVGMLLAADTISRERREGTLDLLFLTDLRVRDVLLGNLLAKSIVPVYGFLALIPALELSVMMGGTTTFECVRLFLVWINSLLFALAASLLVSALTRQQRTAYAGSILVLLAATAGIPALGSFVSERTANATWRGWALLISPSGPFYFGLAKVYAGAGHWFWAALGVNWAIALGFLGLAYALLVQSRSERRIRTGAAGFPAESGKRTALSRDAATRREINELLDSRPADWLAARAARSSWLLWIWSVGAAAVCLKFPIDPFGSAKAESGFLLLIALQSVLKLAGATDAAYAFTADRRSGALESLLATDVDVRAVASGVRRQFWRRYTGPVLLLTGVTLLTAFFRHGAAADAGTGALVLAALMLPFDVYCLFWIGLFQGLAARSPSVALGTGVFEIVLLPWAWLLMCGQVFARNSETELLALWAMVAAGNHLWFVLNAKTQLWRHFRALALKPYGERNPRIESDWSPINWEEAV